MCPMLAIRGENSDLVSPRTLSEMAERHGRLEQHTVPGQGHAPLLRDDATLEADPRLRRRVATAERHSRRGERAATQK